MKKDDLKSKIEMVAIPFSVLGTLVTFFDSMVTNPTLAVAALVATLVLVAILIWQVIVERRRGPGDASGSLDLAAQTLADRLKGPWEAQAYRLGLLAKPVVSKHSVRTSASVLRITWSVDDKRVPKGLLDDQLTKEKLATWQGQADPSRGRDLPGVDRLAAFYRDIQPDVLIVLGSAESGKSGAAILLTLGLLETRDPGGPVPVQFNLAHWERGSSFGDWLVERLLEDHPWLRTATQYGPHAARRLVDEHRVLPVLDGLDELPDEDQIRVVKAINEGSAALPGLIITCRQEEYEHVERQARLHGALVVRLAGVTTAEALRYLEHAAGGDAYLDRWRPVLEHLRRRKKSPLAVTLASPLMVFLVRAVYEHGGSPEELLAPEFKDDPAAIKKHLLQAFIPAVFPEIADRSGSRRWGSKDASHWLGHLAALMGTSSTIGWWEISARVGRPTRIMAGVLAALTILASVGLAFTALFDWRVGLAVGAVAALSFGWVCARNVPPKPSEIQVHLAGRFETILRSGLAIGVIVLIFGAVVRDAWFGLTAAIVFGVPIGLLYGSTEPDPTGEPVDPGYLLRRDIRVGVTFAIAYGVPAGVVGGWLSDSILLGILVGVASALAGAWLYGPIWVFAAFVPRGRGADKADKADKPSKVGVVAFVHLVLATIWLARQGRLPWRVMAFLDHAHEVGVLRQAGAYYEFRHEALREALRDRIRAVDAPAGPETNPPSHAPRDAVATS